ncbi:peptide ABC transporter permease [Paenibacillus sp. BIHB 4019]|uniref:Peptide ABC transporter permease n=1 Tax=Paenibacillus sp. BIHB 4019 TaxID=1870819 RepID=A0A1B2DKX6_9BACL|nr:ABC transporter permease [Paenibacillus sp. BIHB 4019]ANY68356.1 peptide ABC transporter permease [Paenibacillus sp. BIHB 4019]
MRNYVLKRLGLAVVTLLVILLALFLMLELMPGSPFNDEKITQAQRAVLDAKYGLDQPVFNRFVHYIKAMLSGDFGVSYVIQKNMPISAMLEARLPVSIQIGFQAVLLGTVIGLLLGIIAALKHNSIADSLTTFVSVIGVSFPSYVFALALSYFLGWKLKWFPLLYSSASPFVSTVLPTIALSMFTIATVARFTRSEMIEVLSSEYIRLSESKGVGSARLIIVHALRNALIPIITVLAPLVVALMTGSLVIEQIFAIPGIGSLLVTAIQINDYNVIIAVSFLYSIMFIAIMLAVDILYGVIDPRIRLAKGEKHG